MTIKRNGDRVILKNGKVSCSCCEAGECCMYPAQALADGLYSADDLPDAVDFTYSALGNTFGPYTLTRTGTVFRGGPDDEVVIELIGEIWGSADGGGGLESFPCLINETFQPSGGGGYEITVEDQFADTYTATFEIPEDEASPGKLVELIRVTLCIWQGFDPDYGVITLQYNSSEYKFEYYSEAGNSGFKKETQSKPDADSGEYEDGFSQEYSIINFKITE